MNKNPVRIVIVDDSPVFRKYLEHVVESSDIIKVVGTAPDGREARTIIGKLHPDVVLMDIHMPGLDGFETTAQIMSETPVPVIMMSNDFEPSEVAKTFKALEAGAVDILPKPPGFSDPGYDKAIKKIISHIRLMSEVKVVRRTSGRKSSGETEINKEVGKRFSAEKENQPRVIGIGASAGGPPVLQKILSGIESHYKIPIVIVQHIDSLFTEGFARFLETTTGRKITTGSHGMMLTDNMIVMPPADMHIGFAGQGVIELDSGKPDRGIRPSVHHLFESMAKIYGKDSAAIILTGMGNDGVVGMSALREKGAVTIAQDEKSSMIHGMPGEAIKAGAAKYIMNIEQIVDYLNDLNQQKK